MDHPRELLALVELNATTTAKAIGARIASSGICLDDFRLASTMAKLKELNKQQIDSAG